MYYEQIRSVTNNYFFVSRKVNENFNFPLHLHGNYELIYVEDGVLSVEINHCLFNVKKGEAAFILPNQPHKFSSHEYNRSWLAIFSSDHIPELKKLTSGKRRFHPVIKINDPHLKDRLCNVQDSPLRIRSALYELAALYCEGEEAPEVAGEDGALVCRVVEYIDSHYTEDITLEKIARTLGYSYRYMSGVINRFFGQPLPKVINRYRVNYACDLLLNTEEEITGISLLCGFGSVRNFNRNFKAVMGVSPREYRNENLR
ncbi:MAG: helix-turn-helix transcriptional regulator [Clostridia bacterium]|nr:helix-turn-helix transcriptional regulator [Clostridia bacterium]